MKIGKLRNKYLSLQVAPQEILYELGGTTIIYMLIEAYDVVFIYILFVIHFLDGAN